MAELVPTITLSILLRGMHYYALRVGTSGLVHKYAPVHKTTSVFYIINKQINQEHPVSIQRFMWVCGEHPKAAGHYWKSLIPVANFKFTMEPFTLQDHTMTRQQQHAQPFTSILKQQA